MKYTSPEEAHERLTDGQSNSSEKRSCSTQPFLLVAILVLVIVAAVYSIKSYNNQYTPVEPTTPGIINVGVEKTAVREYYQSGQWGDDLWGLAGVWMTYWTSQTFVAKNTVVFDVDETLLDNMQEILDNDFAFIPSQWDPWVNSSAAPAISQIAQIFNYLNASGYSVILLTGRRDTQLAATRLNLQRQNITGYAQLILRSPAEYSMTATQYKSQRRQGLQTSGAFNIVGCIGDQISDCAGGFAGYTMKIPNYAYFIE